MTVAHATRRLGTGRVRPRICRSVKTRSAAVAAIVPLLLLLTACTPKGTPAATPATSPAPSASSSSPAVSSRPFTPMNVACADALPSPAVAGLLLTPADRVEQVVVCDQTVGTGNVAAHAVRLPQAQQDAVVRALRLPDRTLPKGSFCTTNLVVVRDFVVRIDGRWVAPRVPSDGCHPWPAVVRALNDLQTGVPESGTSRPDGTGDDCAWSGPSAVAVRHLRSEDRVDALQVCPSRVGTSVHKGPRPAVWVPAADVGRIAALLSVADTPMPDVCDARGDIVPLVRAKVSGTWVQVVIPRDRCHPRADVLAALAEVPVGQSR